jgi:nitrite reductase (NADH) small subunit
MRPAKLGEVSIVVVHTPAGKICALRDRCSHMPARLSRGRLEYAVVGDDVGDYALSDELVIRCPWHGHEYSVESGRCVADSAHRVRTYAVTIEEGNIVIER